MRDIDVGSRGTPRLSAGDYQSIDAAPGVFAYTRRANSEAAIGLNMSNRIADGALTDPGRTDRGRVALGTHGPNRSLDPRGLSLRRFEGAVVLP